MNKTKKHKKNLFLLLFIMAISVLPYGAFAQINLRGKVLDEAGQPLPGAAVKLKNGTSGTLTGANGDFEIKAPSSNVIIVVSYIGYISQEISVAGKTNVTVTLNPDQKSLQEVIVIGYGTQRAEAVTGSVATVRGDVLREVPSTNITQAMQGRLAGVELSQTSSQPGAAMQIRIRGTRSLNATNDPFIVLDGIPFSGSISDINSDDIKSLDILKDASATAIYGARGANGVILITTNKGQAGQAAKVSYSSYIGTKDVFSKYPMMNGQEFVALRKAAGKYTNALDEADDVNTDWQDLLYRKGIMTNHDVNVTGGLQQGNYSFSAGYLEDQGVIPTQQYNKYSVRGSLDQGVGKYFRFGFTTNTNYSKSQGSNVGMYGVLSMSPIANPYDANGNWKRTIKMPLDEQWSYSKDVVESLKDQWLSETRALGSYNSMYGEVKIPGVEGLKYKVNIGLNYRQSNGGSYTGEGINNTNPLTPSAASISNSLTTSWVIENLLTYDRTFAEKHQINAVALYSASEDKYNSSRVSAKDIPADAFQFYNLGRAEGEITIDPTQQPYTLSGLLSWMGRVMYSYDNKYMISATLRSDGSSRLAPGHQWHTYPAISLGWNIKKESFMNNIDFIDMLKLRFGFGQTSNQSVKPYATLGLLNTRPYNFGDTYSTGYYVTELPNPDLGWEFSKTTNYGLDFSLLKSRLSGTVEYYDTRTHDLLMQVSLQNMSGVSSYTANIGKTQNKGIELSLNGVILEDLNGWRWEAGINLYTNRNKIVELASGTTEDKTNWWFVGHPIDVIYDYQKIGIWQENEATAVKQYEGSAGQPGMIKVLYSGDYNADGSPTRTIGQDDRQIISMEPKLQGGFNTRVSYKGFDFTAVGAFKDGGVLISTLYSSSGYLNMMSGRRGNVKVDYWTPENPGAKYPKPGGVMDGDNPKYGSTLGYFDASYLKIRALTLGYSFDNSKWLKKIGVDGLRLYATAQNPFVLFSPYHKESGMDPETNSYGDENAAVTTTYQKRLLTLGTNAPSTRNYLFGLNLRF
ncbi:SusC/RagA family TonB-linked outer membrane protein [Pseudopedobacter beijingensis]|uniref:SusC/RagA family TonB-linked outer membrane protein n=1 Tax=Pseudopedobacter beijingensis TaxID=1207056 RepID=A0ABW4I9G5_9SPHI